VGLLCAVCCLVSAIAHRQEAGGAASLKGQVVDQPGGAIKDATVILLNGAAVRLQQTRTDESGAFVFPNIHPGTYVLEVERSSFARMDKTVAIATGQAQAEVSIEMKVAGPGQQITVTAESGSFRPDESSTATKTNIPLSEIPQGIGVANQSLERPGQAFQACRHHAAIVVDLSGRTLDPHHQAVGGARLTISSLFDSSTYQTRSDDDGMFFFRGIETGNYLLTADATGFVEVKRNVSVVAGQPNTLDVQFDKLAPQEQQLTVTASEPAVLTPDPSERTLVHNDVLEANPGRPGAPISIPGLPIETASGGIKAPQYFAPGVAGDHGEPIAQFYQVGDYLYPNNLPANAHGNGYADPNFLISRGIGTVQQDGGAFNVREGNHAVDLAVAYDPQPRFEPFIQMTGDYRDIDFVSGWSPSKRDTQGWIALEGSFGNGLLERPEHRKQYKVNGYRVFHSGNHDLTLFGVGYYGFSFVPGLIPTDVPVPGGTVDDRQLDRTHTTIFVASDSWKLRDSQSLIFSGFFRTYSLTLRSDFGDGLIQQSEFRTVAGGDASYVYRIRKTMTLLAGIDLRRDAPRNLDLQHADANGIFQPVTSNDLTLGFIAPHASIDGTLSPYLHYDLGLRREEVNMDNLDKINPRNSFNKLDGITLPKGTLTILPPARSHLPTAALSYGEAFHTNDPRIGTGTSRGTVIVPSRALQLVLKEEIRKTELKLTLARVANAQELAKIDPDTGLQVDVGPSIIPSITVAARHQFSFGLFQASFARANAHDRLTGEPTPEAPRLIWDVLGSFYRLPAHLQVRGEFEYVGSKPLGDGFTAVPVREVRGAIVRPFVEGRMELGLNFLVAHGFTGQTLGDNCVADRACGV
jgi:hypothetical protein